MYEGMCVCMFVRNSWLAVVMHMNVYSHVHICAYHEIICLWIYKCMDDMCIVYIDRIIYMYVSMLKQLCIYE